MPSHAHELRVAILDALAVLAGYTDRVASPPPNGGRPDVLRRDPGCSSIFIGEAKDTETPAPCDTAERLAVYLRFFAAAVRAGAPLPVFAVCVRDEPAAWRRLLLEIGVGLELPLAFDVTDVPDGVVLWVRLARVRRVPSGHIFSSGQRSQRGCSGRHNARPCETALTWNAYRSAGATTR